jgi:D-serine deaminase-like pyridoxal phosphate-dependent protein
VSTRKPPAIESAEARLRELEARIASVRREVQLCCDDVDIFSTLSLHVREWGERVLRALEPDAGVALLQRVERMRAVVDAARELAFAASASGRALRESLRALDAADTEPR